MSLSTESKAVGRCLPTPERLTGVSLHLTTWLPSLLLVLCVSTEEGEKIFRGNHLLEAGIRKVPFLGEELWHLAALDPRSGTCNRTASTGT